MLEFGADLNQQLSQLRVSILDETLTLGQMTAFRIRDPKPRLIHAPCFRDRVLHHAVMAYVGPVLDRALVDDTYACRIGRGTLAAVKRCQQHCRRFNWYVQIDISGYFAHIDHAVLISLLRRKFKDKSLLRLLEKIIDAFHVTSGKGLPIGALTSQHFANFYLSELDRLLLEKCRVQGMVRYMDDVVWFGQDREFVMEVLKGAEASLLTDLRLEIKQPFYTNVCRSGLTFCGYRILPGALRLTRRRKRGYIAGRQKWENYFDSGQIDELTLQSAYASVLGATQHADASAWRREQLYRNPVAGSAADL